MTSLRTRLLVSVLTLSAAGLIALAAVTYASQRSFLLGRVDQQLRQAGPALSHALDNAGVRPFAGDERAGGGPPPFGEGAPPGAPPGGGPGLNLPPGTYAQRRDASGRVQGHILISYGQPAPAAPRIPAQLPVGRLLTLGSIGSSGLRYRAYASRDQSGATTLIAVPLHEVQQTLNRLLLVEALVIAGVLVVLGLTASLAVRIGLRPLDRMEATAGQIAAGELSRRVSPADSRTEVGRLGLALNAMLERLERAFDEREASEARLRRFLADASHELRTPLASIRGYAELFRLGAAADPAETELAMRRIEEESARMGVLVEDLLTLARLDQPPASRREPLDMTALAHDAVSDARATAPDREIDLSADRPAIVSGDRHQLAQLLANLLGNALVHTPASAPIEVSVSDERTHVQLAVRDHGLGLPDGSPERLFDRFWRAQAGRERGRAGAGLGLAIASAVVTAHGGQIEARDAPGGGALFIVRLPRERPSHTARATG
jgi:two-component system, OmpR family, sensor kinase